MCLDWICYIFSTSTQKAGVQTNVKKTKFLNVDFLDQQSFLTWNIGGILANMDLCARKNTECKKDNFPHDITINLTTFTL